MATVRVGVERIKKGTGYQVEAPGDDGVEVFQKWVEIDGTRFMTDEVGLLDVSYALGQSDLLRDSGGDLILDQQGRATREHPNNLMGEITIRFNSSGFSTVDHRVPPRGD